MLGRLATATGGIPPTIRGVILMLFSGACYAGMAAIIKSLADAIHPLEMVFFRNMFGLVAITPFLFRRGVRGLWANDTGVFLLRGVGQITSQGLFYLGVSFATLAAAVTLSMMQGILLAIGAVIFLGEPSMLRRWLAAGTGFIGALIVIRPDGTALASLFGGGDDMSLRAFGAVLVLISTVGYAALSLNGKVLARDQPIPNIIARTLIIASCLSFIVACFFWTWPTPTEWLFMFLMGILGTAGNAMMTRAMVLGEVTVMAPLTYVRVVWGALFGFIVFSEVPDLWTWVGAALIVTAGLYLSQLERGQSRRKNT